MTDVSTPPRSTGSPPNGDTGKAEEAAGQAKDKAQEVAGQAQEKAQQAAGQAKDRVREQVDQRSTQAGEQVTGTAGDRRAVADTLREQGKDQPAKLAQQAADRTERLGSYLTESSSDRILSDVEDFARKQPWAVVAGGIALGFAASRFLKASSSERYQAGRSSGSPHTSPSNGHPAGTGVRSDRDVGGPTTAPVAPGGATGGAPGTPPGSGFSSHR
ncbi:MAG: hypothetical protein QOE08_289 [Thermoleophilaceae bacterium]|nr:hypothetical protein [Thermoleophilaceae bacterium]